jgi:cation diffusion facilitator family transporter
MWPVRKNSVDVRDKLDPGIRVTFLGMLVNLLLLIAKFVIGFLTGSVGLIADGTHTASDVATDLVVLGGIHLGGRDPDTNHAYGHGRYETLSGGIVAGVLMLAGLLIVWEAGSALYSNQLSYPGLPVLLVAAGSILGKEWLYRRTIRVARRIGSTALHANAWHHRSDALSSVAVLLGGVAGLLGWGHADQVAGIIVGLMVAYSGGRTLLKVLHELTEGALSERELSTINAAVASVPQVNGWHQLRSRRVGRERFIDLHVLVEPSLSLLEGHRISMLVEQAIQQSCEFPVNVLVHVEPDTPELDFHQRQG